MGSLAQNFGIANFGGQPTAPQGRPGGPAYQDALTEQVRPLSSAHWTHHNASQWEESLTTLMLVFGVLLVACFVAPWSVGAGKTSFAWSILSVEGASLAAKAERILLCATGIIAIAIGALRLTGLVRSFAATGIGLSPLIFDIASAGSFQWQGIVGALGGVLFVTGLIVRARYPSVMLGRILATVGALAIVVLYVVPVGDSVPIVAAIKAVGAVPGKAKVVVILGMGPLLLALLGLLVWLPPTKKPPCMPIAWTFLFWGLITMVATLFIGGEILSNIKAGLSTYFYLPLAAAAWLALASFGIAGIIGNKFD